MRGYTNCDSCDKLVNPRKLYKTYDNKKLCHKCLGLKMKMHNEMEDIPALYVTIQNIARDDKRHTFDYDAPDLVKEAEYLLTCFFEEGHERNEELNSETPEESNRAKSQITKLKKFIKKYKNKFDF